MYDMIFSQKQRRGAVGIMIPLIKPLTLSDICCVIKILCNITFTPELRSVALIVGGDDTGVNCMFHTRVDGESKVA